LIAAPGKCGKKEAALTFHWRSGRFARTFSAMVFVRFRSVVFAVAFGFGTAAFAESPTKSPQASPAFKTPRPEPQEAPRGPEPRPPLQGQPFDDREVSLFLEIEGRKLFTNGRCGKLVFDHRACGLSLADVRDERLTWPAIAARAEAATVVLGEFYREPKSKKDEFSTAAGGFLISAGGACVTSLHVVNGKGARGFVALTRDGHVLPVREVLAADPLEDLAILQLEVPDGILLPSLPLAPDPAPVGASVGVMSHPDERFYLFTMGSVGRHTVWRERGGAEHFMSITADFAKGSSGCPVLDERGAVVGVVNNTESIYYDDDGKKKQTDLQMVVKNATPSWVVRSMTMANRGPRAELRSE
jgi:S1-C subfamily serine protease